MQHRLLMENWRKFINEAPYHDHGPGAFTPKIPVTKKEMDNLASMLTFVEPTGQISDSVFLFGSPRKQLPCGCNIKQKNSKWSIAKIEMRLIPFNFCGVFV